MEIPQVFIGPGQPKKIRISRKTLRHAERYLSEKGFSLDQLTDSQQQCVFKYVKAKRALRWSVVIGIILGLAGLVLCFHFIRVVTLLADMLMPDATVIVLDDGTKKVVELDRELIGNYGKMCALLGFVFAAALYTMASAFAGAIGSILRMRETKKMFDAFLPAVGACYQSEQSGVSDPE